MLDYAPFDDASYPPHGSLVPRYQDYQHRHRHNQSAMRRRDIFDSSIGSYQKEEPPWKVDGWNADSSISSSMPVDRLADDVHLLASQTHRLQEQNTKRNINDREEKEEELIGMPPSMSFGSANDCKGGKGIVAKEVVVTRSPREAMLLSATYGVLGIVMLFMFDHVRSLS